MKKLVPGLLFLLLSCLGACKKGNDGNDNGNNGGNGGGTTPSLPLLAAIIKNAGTTDSTSFNYSYDASGRLTESKITGLHSGVHSNSDLRIVWNASGVITQAIQKSSYNASMGIDSVIVNYHYNTASGQFSSSVGITPYSGGPTKDSTVYQYDVSGKIGTEVLYRSVAGGVYAIIYKEDFSYSAGNVSSMAYSSYNQGTSAYTLVYTNSYTYDTKFSPLQLGNNAILLSMQSAYGPNNVIQYNVNYISPPNNSNETIVFTYNSNNEPTGGTDTIAPSNTASAITYYYQ